MKSGALLYGLLVAQCIIAQEHHIALNDGWSFRRVGAVEWRSATVPGFVQQDLLRHGLIPDFMRGTNIDSVQWVELQDWEYRRNVSITEAQLGHDRLDLVFKGLDTFAEVYLNDSLLGTADNMFRTWVWPVRSALRHGENELRVVLRSTHREGQRLRREFGITLPHDSDTSGISPFVRKAAYQFGWDFCPRLVTMGIWQDVELRACSGGRIAGVRFSSTTKGRNSALQLEPDVELAHPIQPRVRVWVNGERVYQGRLKGRSSRRSTTVVIPDEHAPKWSPMGEGQRSLQQIRVELLVQDEILSIWEDHVGHHAVTLDRSRDSIGEAFRFLVNGRPVFMRGANVVPPSMLPDPSMDQAWVDLVAKAKAAGMNMLRVWAGGVYPPEPFYDACDTAGIMVWQDLMLGGIGPGDEDFQRNVRREVELFAARVGHHPCIVLYCGDNELEVAWNHWGLQDRYGLHGPDSVQVRRAYLHLRDQIIPRALHGVTPVTYTPTSPLSNWGNVAGLSSGDLHYWGVWHGDSTFASFGRNVGRFVSEYGFQSYPDSTLLSRYVDPHELYLGSAAMDRMQRSYKTDRPIWEAIQRELGHTPTNLDRFIEAGQEVQALAYRTAAEAHLAARPHCMGTLLWQLNDCWPGPSWSIVDFEGRPKPAYQAIREVYTRP